MAQLSNTSGRKRAPRLGLGRLRRVRPSRPSGPSARSPRAAGVRGLCRRPGGAPPQTPVPIAPLTLTAESPTTHYCTVQHHVPIAPPRLQLPSDSALFYIEGGLLHERTCRSV